MKNTLYLLLALNLVMLSSHAQRIDLDAEKEIQSKARFLITNFEDRLGFIADQRTRSNAIPEAIEGAYKDIEFVKQLFIDSISIVEIDIDPNA